MEEWALIRRLVADGVPKAKVARELGISRTTVDRAVASDQPPKYVRKPAEVTSFTPFEPQVRSLLLATPQMPATVIAERVGWSGSIRWFRDNVNRLRSEQGRVDPADRLEWAPGDAVQCDLWFPPFKFLLEDGTRRLLPVLVMTLAYSRFMLARIIPTRTTADLLLGMWSLLSDLGAVPARLLWDNEKGIGQRRLTQAAAMFAGTLATKIVLLKPYDPESKGIVERSNGYLETSFMPGRHFDSPADFDEQLSGWLTAVANARTVRTIKARPTDRLPADLARMRPLPPQVLHLGWRNQVRLGRDYYVRLDSNDYSVDPSVIGASVDVTADLDTVRVRAAGRLVAEHRRCWGRQMTITDPDHLATATALRQAFQQPLPKAVGHEQSLQRDLADYDKAFGLNGSL